MNPPPERMVSISADVLASLLCIDILVRWIPSLWINPTLVQASLFVLLAVWGIRTTYRPFVLYGSFALWPLGMITGWGLLQLAMHTTVSRWETSYAVFTWAGNFAVFFLALEVCHSAKIRRRFLQILLIFGFLISVTSMLEFFSSPRTIFWFYDNVFQAFGPFQNRDRYPAFAELVMPLAILKALKQDDPRKALWYTGIAGTFFAAVIADLSRAGVIVIVAEAILVLVAAGRQQRFAKRIRMTTLKFALAAAIFTAVVGVSTLLDRFHDPDPFQHRRELTISAVLMAKERPWFGFGLGNFENAYPQHAVMDSDLVENHVHNDLAEWTAEGGIPFLIMMLSLLAWAAPRAFKSCWGIGILAVFANSLTYFPLQDPSIELWVFAFLGVLAAESATL